MKPALVFDTPNGRARVVSVADARELDVWRASLRHLAKDHRYYELIDATLGFDCRCLILEDHAGRARAAQPFFVVDQDLVAAAPAWLRACAGAVRRVAPRALRMRMLMAGCAAGEGHPGAESADEQRWLAATAGEVLLRAAPRLGASLVVWKDVPARYRPAFAGYERFARMASMPATRIALDGADWEEFMARHLGHAMRKNLRRKFRALTDAPPIGMEVVNSVAGIEHEVHALYAQVLAKARLRFERLTPEFLLQLGERMPDRARFFLWRQEGRLVACSIALVHDGVLYDEYLGLDYRVALDLHLYFTTFRDMVSWALAQRLRAYHSTPLNYAPKLRLGFTLEPLDLYLAHPRISFGAPIRRLLRLLLRLLEPVRGEPVLREFPNAHELHS